MKNIDLTFITNEGGQSLKQRFEVLIKDTRLFDCLVGYFYTSGFHAIYKSLENTEKIRILIGISTNRQTHDLLKTAAQDNQQKRKTKAPTPRPLSGRLMKWVINSTA